MARLKSGQRYALFWCYSLAITLVPTFSFPVETATSADDVAAPETKPIIARIETFGLRSVSQQAVIKASELEVGDNLANIAGDEINVAEVIRRIEAVPGVHKASFAAIYGMLLKGDKLGMVVYLGIVEPGIQQLEYKQAPSGAATLPSEILAANSRMQQAFAKAAASGLFGEDRTMGHSLSEDSDLRAAQQAFVPLAQKHWSRLVDVLHTSHDGKQRAIAAQVIAYAPDKLQVVHELVAAMSDSNSTVRNNSTRALSIIFEIAASHPEVSLNPPIELVRNAVNLLDSVDWSDRNKAVGLLLNLDGSQVVLRQVRKNSIPSLIEMSNWQTVHGSMAFMLLGRLADLTHEESQQVWNDNKQASVFARVHSLTTSSRE
ncbi:hypothetical protein [Bythopirellula goksoeyrii]|uniref:HEAT repeat protein n=1 Tax=Bythopirellula goksoeyrii TaxID=1400387 RepID=A0A5B9Q292_9BACT|nr:hypothetical protein [Bythopirellula goksoeyrii]QEG33094.1 hypothetical protein Pr1d_03550 [Bythopirellula goksoeyrii]